MEQSDYFSLLIGRSSSSTAIRRKHDPRFTTGRATRCATSLAPCSPGCRMPRSPKSCNSSKARFDSSSRRKRSNLSRQVNSQENNRPPPSRRAQSRRAAFSASAESLKPPTRRPATCRRSTASAGSFTAAPRRARNVRRSLAPCGGPWSRCRLCRWRRIAIRPLRNMAPGRASGVASCGAALESDLQDMGGRRRGRYCRLHWHLCLSPI